MLLLALALVACIATLASAQTDTTTATNTTVTVIRITGAVVYRFNATVVQVFPLNQSSLQLTYLCMYEANYSEDCTPVQVKVYNNTTLRYTVDFTDLGTLCGVLPGLCRGERILDITGFSLVVVEIYDSRTGRLLEKLELPVLAPAPRLSGLLQLLYLLIPAGIIGGFAARGSMRMIGVGFLLAGLSTLLLPYIGIYPPSYYSLFVVLILVGVIIIWYSR